MSIKKRLLLLFKNDFNKNFSILLAGSFLSQLIPLFASIILARIYKPEDFGLLAIYNGLCAIIIPIVSLRYEFAVSLPKREKDSISLVVLAICVNAIICLSLLIIIIVFKDEFLNLIGGVKLNNFIYLVPLTAFLGGIFNILNYFAIRHKKYKEISSSNVTKSFFLSLSQLLFGLVKATSGSLIIGYLVSNVLGNAKLTRVMLSFKGEFKNVSYSRIVQNAKRYKNFPLISTWGTLMNSMGINLNNFFISNLYGVGVLGYYSYSYRYLNLPLNLISNNLGQIFYQVCSECHRDGTNARQVFLSTLKKILFIMTPIFVFLYFTVEKIFVLFFGEEWIEAGEYAVILLPLFFCRTVYSPLSLISLAFEKQKLTLFMQLLIFSSNILAFLLASILQIGVDGFLYLYTYVSASAYLILTCVLYLVAIKKL